MAAEIVNAEVLRNVANEIEEACGLLHTLIELDAGDGDGATAMREAMVHLARRAGWLLDRCSNRLGHAGVRGPEWLEWCGGHPSQEVKRGAGRHPGQGAGVNHD